MPSNATVSEATLKAMGVSDAPEGGRNTVGASALPAMEVRGLHFAYGANKILKGVDLQVQAGKVTTILGANGCGKSTLFNIMTKNLRPDRGKVFLRGKNIANMTLKEFARRVSIVHQYNDAAADITVEKLVYMGRTPHMKMMSEPGEDDTRIVEWALEVTNIGQFRDREVSRLSGGQRQRVWIAMALAQNTKILFLDEPTTYLDIRYQIETLELVRKLNRDYGITIVMVLHDINQALYYSDVIIGLAGGRVAIDGAPAEVITQESLEELYGIGLVVTEEDGKKFVLLKDEEADDEPPGEAVGARACAPAAAALDDDACDPPSTDSHVSDATLAAMQRAAKQRAASAGERPDEHAPAAAAGSAPRASEATIAAMRRNGYEPQVVASAAPEQPQAEDAPVRKEPKRSTSKVARALWTVLGVVCFGLGTLGTILPFLPTVPLYLAALFSFAKGSQRLHDWFVGTQLYHKHLESFVDHRGMTMKTKLSIMGTVTVVMAIAFALMGRVPVGRIVLLVVWVFHVIFFIFFVKTEKPEEVESG